MFNRYIKVPTIICSIHDLLCFKRLNLNKFVFYYKKKVSTMLLHANLYRIVANNLPSHDDVDHSIKLEARIFYHSYQKVGAFRVFTFIFPKKNKCYLNSHLYFISIYEES